MSSVQEDFQRQPYVWYGLTIAGAVLVGLLLLFLPELPSFLRRALLPALVIYTMGTALLAHIQVAVTASRNTKRAARGETPEGIKSSHLTAILVVQVLWFLAFAGILAWRYLAG